MRRAYNNVKFIEDEKTFYGVSLGYDFCAEHEWGIKSLKSLFGIDSTKMGIAGRTITKNDSVFFMQGDKAVLRTNKRYDFQDELTFKNAICSQLSLYDKQVLTTAWDENSFGVAVKGIENVNKLKELHEAFLRKDIIIGTLAPILPAFENASLSLLIKSKLPKEAIDQMMHVDKKAQDLLDYEKKIGVTKLKEKKSGYKAEKYFMACSPKWINYEDKEAKEKRKRELNTKYDIVFWVNYSDDDDNYGWYTAEDIIKWLSTPGLKLKSLNKEKV